MATQTSRRPALEAISVLLDPAPHQDPAALLDSIVRGLPLQGWQTEPVTRDHTEIELVPPKRIPTARAWNLTHALRAHPAVVHAEPMFRHVVPENSPAPAGRASTRGGTDDPSTDGDFEWSLARARVREGWALFGSRRPGAGVLVAHPDTGYTRHPELAEPARLLVGAGYDFADGDPDPLDELARGRRDNPGHGTSTGSVIVSAAAGAAGVPHVSGIAPHASLIPIRTTTSVVLFSMRALRQSVDHATGAGARVISISLGGLLPGFGLQRALARANDRGIIVVAAAGNEVDFVVFPAAFEEVVAAAASGIRDVPWRASSHGRPVDITAPGESVWRARVTANSAGAPLFDVARGTGTSYAAAAVAGAAALWVSYHGADTLDGRYGPAAVPRVFRAQLMASARVPAGWNTREYGAGLLDVLALLQRPLPQVAPTRKLRRPRRAVMPRDAAALEAFAHIAPAARRIRVEEVLAGLLRVSDRELPSALQRHGDELFFHLVMNPPILAGFRRATATRGARASTGMLRRRVSGLDLSAALSTALA